MGVWMSTRNSVGTLVYCQLDHLQRITFSTIAETCTGHIARIRCWWCSGDATARMHLCDVVQSRFLVCGFDFAVSFFFFFNQETSGVSSFDTSFLSAPSAGRV